MDFLSSVYCSRDSLTEQGRKDLEALLSNERLEGGDEKFAALDEAWAHTQPPDDAVERKRGAK